MFVARQLGHASPSMTLGTYAALFDGQAHADKMAAMLEADFATTIAGR